jgi:ankyrin repeat protein
MITGDKRAAIDEASDILCKKSRTMTQDELEIWKSINLEQLNIKALYQFIKSKNNSVDIMNKDGYSLLYLAAYNKSTEALRILLLQPDIDVNRLNGPHYELALHAACSKGLIDGVELLIENGSMLDAKDSLGHTPLTNAIFSNSLPCVELLINSQAGADVSVTDAQGNTLLHLAATNNFTESIPLLISKGVPIDQHNQRGLSPLAIAISFGYIDTAIALIDGGADVNGRTRFATVLHHAVTWNRLEIVKKLVELNCNPNVVNILEETPLYLAVQQRKIDIVRYLIEEANADPCFTPNNSSNSTNLPLLYAANHGYTEMSKILITPATSTFFIQTSADMSYRVGHPQTEQLLKEKLSDRLQSTSSSHTTTPTGNPINTVATTSDKDDDAFASLFNTFSDEEEI